MKKLPMPRITISAPHRSSGKSTVAIGLSAALASRGLDVQPFKKGPDFIDPMWHEAASGRKSRNLDIFMMGEEAVSLSFRRHARGADISVIEGNMGLYDGMDMEGSDSTAGLARLLKSPVILVIDCHGMTRGVAPLVKGFEEFEPGTNVAGVILNKVRNKRHEKKLRDAISRYCKAEVLGALPYEEGMGIGMRHLGLIPYKEDTGLSPVIGAIEQAISAHVDIDRVIEIARKAPPLDAVEDGSSLRQFDVAKITPPASTPQNSSIKPAVRIGVAMDRAFTFYYPENLDALADAGAELVPFSPMNDSALPKVDALYIGGGFPEAHMEALEKNAAMRNAVRDAAEAGMPVYAECGGLMYLCRSISWKGVKAMMAGVFPYDVEMSGRPAGHGYVIMRPSGEGGWPSFGDVIRAHEFHHSSLKGIKNAVTAFVLDRGKGVGDGRDGLLYRNVLAAYAHIHNISTPLWASQFVAFINKKIEKNSLDKLETIN